MGRYLDMLKHLESGRTAKLPADTVQDRTDKTDITPKSASVSGMSVPIPSILPENSSDSTRALPDGRWDRSGRWVTGFAEGQGEQLAQILKPDCWVEWLSPALPRQQGEVLDVDLKDQTFTVFHPLSEMLCRLPIAWITRIITTEMEG